MIKSFRISQKMSLPKHACRADNSRSCLSILVTRASSDPRPLVALTGHRFPRFLCAAPLRAATWVFAGLSLRSSQFAASTPFGVRPSVHPRSPPPGEYACVPTFPSRQESAVNYLFANVRGSTRAAIAIVDRQSALTSDQDSRKTLTPSKGAITWTLLS